MMPATVMIMPKTPTTLSDSFSSGHIITATMPGTSAPSREARRAPRI
jgi:hypothetical protein